ncbi:MAG: Stk1 family PASTA domain-containing Ser/Thr kinase [Bacilli bacterium]|nr:Stk1 family PASTA domain-containing Ser/Thr kinase [Bacilli bacterium]MDD4719029.1 Stk1 family PASTA domain-containing Ser/Thr kinase [Bacilli bacterium]
MIIKGQKINDRYQIIRLIGEGGMANVYLAQDTILDRKVAVKILRGDLADDEKFVRRFQREAISASSLNHPNIVEMYDVGEDDGKYFIVMEYIDGRTLKSLIKKRGALTVEEVVDIMLQLVSGIIHAHNGYIIHRDIKPQNVLILDDGRLKITDFGIAMALNSNELTQTNSVMGSVHYLPPEQANGNGATIKSDIYSLGILMYELLIGKIPFRGENAVEIAIKQMKEQIPSVCKQNPDIPQSLENIVLKSCAKNPKNRYDNVSEMYTDIENALKEENKNAKRIVYKYPEQDLEETKVMPTIKDGKEKENKSIDNKEKKVNNILIILSATAIGLIALLGLMIIFLPKLTAVPEVKIPDVSNMSVEEAEKKLIDLGLKINPEIKEENHNEIEEGKVTKTRPSKNNVAKKGNMITLYISQGVAGLVLENYVDKNYYEIKALLETQGMYVLIEKKQVDDVTKYKENIIIEQKPEVGTKLVEGDTVTLYLPDIITEYPDFVSEQWSITDIEAFALEYQINLSIEYKEDDSYPEGTIISQSRPAKSQVMLKASLKIVVATKPVEEEPIDEIIPEGES